MSQEIECQGNIVNMNDQGNIILEKSMVQGINLSVNGTFGKDQSKTEHDMQENGILANSPLISAPLRLTGGGDTSFESSNDVLSFVNQDNSMSEQDMRDVLFEAGYPIETI